MIIIDLEMSGVDSRQCGIIEIGAIEFENPSNTFCQTARLEEDEIVLNEPAATIPILELLGLTEQDMRSKERQSQEQLLKNFFEWVSKVKDKIMVAQNFMDMDFLNAKTRKYKMPKLKFRFLDIHSVAQTRHKLINKKLVLDENGWSNMGLGKIAEFCGLKDERKVHTALGDARFEAEIVSRLLEGKNLLEEYKTYPVPTYLK